MQKNKDGCTWREGVAGTLEEGKRGKKGRRVPIIPTIKSTSVKMMGTGGGGGFPPTEIINKDFDPSKKEKSPVGAMGETRYLHHKTKSRRA